LNSPLAPWRSPLARALHRNRSLVYARYLQLATVRSDGRPANRTVVFRNFLPETNQLKFIADRRSEKIAQLVTQPWAEACWYFPKTREQFRLLGKLNLVDLDCADLTLQAARKTTWHDLSENARSSFFWPEPKADRAEQLAFEVDVSDSSTPIDTFCLLLFDPIEVDHLELRGEPQSRWLYQQADDGAWSINPVNP
jgi:pyridoxamine 5'-phosphate oxidase